MEIKSNEFGKYVEIDGERIDVFENGMEIFKDWDWDYAYDENDQETYTREIDIYDFDFKELKEYKINGKTYIYCNGDFGEFLLNRDGNYTVFLAIKKGEVVGVFETEEEAEGENNAN